ncbi:MAG: hypothetical protein KatS3mg082_2043 [Nitrospiraceae bacterium]|nr:MAG: hypothetical protein KatS3mg082_2043 [Nitrospiraceae bacterium]
MRDPHAPRDLPDHPLVKETVRDCLTEAMDLDGLIAVLQRIERGEIRCVAVDTPVPSPFCHEILNANPYAYLDDAPLEERRARAVDMRRTLPPEVGRERRGVGPRGHRGGDRGSLARRARRRRAARCAPDADLGAP